MVSRWPLVIIVPLHTPGAISSTCPKGAAVVAPDGGRPGRALSAAELLVGCAEETRRKRRRRSRAEKDDVVYAEGEDQSVDRAV